MHLILIPNVNVINIYISTVKKFSTMNVIAVYCDFRTMRLISLSLHGNLSKLLKISIVNI